MVPSRTQGRSLRYAGFGFMLQRSCSRRGLRGMRGDIWVEQLHENLRPGRASPTQCVDVWNSRLKGALKGRHGQ
jgi:hypothetical protein